jgi:hypothetical protein
MALAKLEHLAAIGAIPWDYEFTDEETARVEMLIEMASAQVARYQRTTQASLAGWSDDDQMVVATVVAEAAASRMNVAANRDTDPYTGAAEGMITSLLARRHYRTLDRLLGRAGRGSRTVETDRAPETSFLNYSDAGRRWLEKS